MMADILGCNKYSSDASDSDDEECEAKSSAFFGNQTLDCGLESTSASESIKSSSCNPLSIPVISTPDVFYENEAKQSCNEVIDPTRKELLFNPKYEQLFAPEIGPTNPFKSAQQSAKKNTLTGFVEPAEFNDFQFDNQRKTFHSYGYAFDPSADAQHASSGIVGNIQVPGGQTTRTVFESKLRRECDQRKRERNMDSGDVEGYTGPWGGYVDEVKISKPDEETMKILQEYSSKKKRFAKAVKADTAEEKSVLHINDPHDYQGRSFLHAPHDLDGVNLRSDEPPDKCFIPKKLLHTWEGHTKAIHAIRWFPKTAHLLLSCSMDAKIKLWEVYKGRRCVRTYHGHRQAVRDVRFNCSGNEFLSASYDRYIKLWDTETGQCKQRFTTGKVPYCVVYYPDESKEHMVLSGMADKKIVQWDTRSGAIVQEYDRHLGAVNTISFFDNNRRFCTTSDDKSMRIWEWEIPVDTKLIQDASLHSMPTVTMSPNHKWLAAQSMDNKIVIFQVVDDKMRFNRRKQFTGHMVAGYACSIDFSPDMTYIVSGDADGKVWLWNWKNHRVAAKWKAHNNVCIGVLWHPHETSKLATAGWDGVIKFWD